MSDRVATLQEIVNTAVALGLRDLPTGIAAKVVKYDAAKQRANCQILVKNVTEAEDGSRQVSSWPVIPGVPVEFFGSGDFRTICEIGDGTGGKACTIGSLVFTFRSLDKWLSGGGAEVDPELDHDHAFTDAIFRPGLHTFGSPWTDVPTAGISMGKDGGLQMLITGDVAAVYETLVNAKFVAIAEKVQNWLDAFNAAVSGWTPIPNDGGAALKLALGTLIGGVPSTNVAASKFKAE